MIVEGATLTLRMDELNTPQEMTEDCMKMHLSADSTSDQLTNGCLEEPESVPNDGKISSSTNNNRSAGIIEDGVENCHNENSLTVDGVINSEKVNQRNDILIMEEDKSDTESSAIISNNDGSLSCDQIAGTDNEDNKVKFESLKEEEEQILPMDPLVQKSEAVDEIPENMPNDDCPDYSIKKEASEAAETCNQNTLLEKLKDFNGELLDPTSVDEQNSNKTLPTSDIKLKNTGEPASGDCEEIISKEETKIAAVAMEICEEKSTMNVDLIESAVNEPRDKATVDESFNTKESGRARVGTRLARAKRPIEDESIKKTPKKQKKRRNSSVVSEQQRRSGNRLRCDSNPTDGKTKTDDCDKKENKNPKEKSIYDSYSNGKFANLTKHGLEEMIMQKVCDYLVNRGPRGDWRQKCAQLEEDRDRLNKITLSLKKQLLDARHIIKKLVEERETNKSSDVLPVKVTRSVGLQVCTAGTFYMRPQSEFRANHKTDPFKAVEQNDNNNKNVSESSSSNKSSVNEIPSSLNSSSSASSSVKLTPQVTMSQTVTSMKALTSSTNLLTASQVKSPILLTKPPVQTKSSSQLQTRSSASSATAPTLPNTQHAVRLPISQSHPAKATESTKTGSPANTNTVVVSQSMLVLPQHNNSTVLSHQGAAVITPIKLQTGQFRAIKPATENSEVNKVTSTEGSAHLGAVQAVNSPNQNLHFLLATPLNGPTSSVASNQKQVSNNMEVIDLTEKDEKDKFINGPVLKVGKQTLRKPFPAITIEPSAPAASTKQMSADSLAVRGHPPMPHKLLVLPLTNIGRGQVGEVISFQDNQKQTLCVVTEKQVIGKNAKAKLPPLPAPPEYGSLPCPPKPYLRICKATADGGIMLSWNFGANPVPTEVASFELFAFQEKSDGSSPRIWNKVGEVKALPLPMACTLTQFVEGHKYHFAVRAVDVFDRIGEFSSPGSIILTITSET